MHISNSFWSKSELEPSSFLVAGHSMKAQSKRKAGNAKDLQSSKKAKSADASEKFIWKQ